MKRQFKICNRKLDGNLIKIDRKYRKINQQSWINVEKEENWSKLWKKWLKIDVIGEEFNKNSCKLLKTDPKYRKKPKLRKKLPKIEWKGVENWSILWKKSLKIIDNWVKLWLK